MNEPLMLVSSDVVSKLEREVDINLERYASGDFTELSKAAGWSIQTSFANWDPKIVQSLDPSGSPEAEISNSYIVYNGLKEMTPALAREERLWTRLCHIEFFEYARARWLNSPDKIGTQVRNHFFAGGLPAARDDNAVGRLWWNGHVASIACPDDIKLGLSKLLARANNRLQIIDRADTAFRQPLIKSIFRVIGNDPWLDSEDKAIARFMFQINKYSGGVIFEAFNDQQVDDHVMRCLELAKEHADQS
jgi:hypothetical protein